jgi:hypothetical protein
MRSIPHEGAFLKAFSIRQSLRDSGDLERAMEILEAEPDPRDVPFG